eukprot:7119315-Pyramimonas_sp.AAC.1
MARFRHCFLTGEACSLGSTCASSRGKRCSSHWKPPLGDLHPEEIRSSPPRRWLCRSRETARSRDVGWGTPFAYKG